MTSDLAQRAWDESLFALRREAERVTTLLRAVDVASSAPVVGRWDLAEVAAHLAQVWVGVPGMARGDWSEVEELLGSENGAPATVSMRTVADLSEFTARMVRLDGERDLTVLAERIEARAKDYFAECANQPPTTRMPWLFDGTTLPVSSFTDHLLSECVVHGFDIASAAGRPWRVEPTHARLALERFLFPIIAMLDPSAAVHATNAAGFSGRYEIRIRGGERFGLQFDDGAMHVERAPSARADCYISADPVALLLLVWSRQSHWHALARGKLLAWGRKPWLAPRLPALLNNP